MTAADRSRQQLTAADRYIPQDAGSDALARRDQQHVDQQLEVVEQRISVCKQVLAEDVGSEPSDVRDVAASSEFGNSKVVL